MRSGAARAEDALAFRERGYRAVKLRLHAWTVKEDVAQVEAVRKAMGDDFVILVDANQEHGIIARRDGGPIDFERFPIGTLLRFLPNHACATAAQHDHYEVFDGPRHLGRWPRVNGW